jgi:membrane-bound metal-dependent hydrolase YbcI (DUF457 family)
MPATPFHLPPNVLVAWPLRHHLDLPSVLLVNLAIDVEPAVAMALGIVPPPHGPVHTLLGATLVGVATGWLLSRGTGRLESVLGGRYDLDRRVAMASGVIGGWLHVLLDSVMYSYLRPFYPLTGNPFRIAGSGDLLHLLAALLLLPVLALVVRERAWRTVPERLTAILLGTSAVWMAVHAGLGGI